MEFFLKIKSWQLFILMVLPLAAFRLLTQTPIYSGVMLVLFVLVAFGWVYSVGAEANERLDRTLKKDTTFFTISFLVPVTYIGFFFYFFLLPLSQGQVQRPPEWLVIVHFASIGCLFYLLWFAAKQFVTLQNKAEVGYTEYGLTLLGLWLGVIGVWFLQPKINRLFQEE